MIALTDEAQGVRRVYAYDDWGNDAGTGGTLSAPNADRARWKGALWMGPELDLYYMRNRWYEPGTGRFLSEDPIGLGGGINPVIFGGGDPVSSRDPAGLQGDCEATGGSGGGALTEDGAQRLPDVGTACRQTKPLAAPAPFTPPQFPDPPCPGCGQRDPNVGGGGPTGPRNQVAPESAPSCTAEFLSLAGNLGVDVISTVALGGGGAPVVKGGALLLRGSAAEASGIIIRSGATTIRGVFQQQATRGLGAAGRAASASVQNGQSLIGVGSGLIAADITAAISAGALRPFSVLDLVPFRGTYLAGKAFFQCVRQ